MSRCEVGQDELTMRPPKPEETRRLGDIAVAAWEPVFASFRSLLGDEIFSRAHPDWRADKRGHVEGRVRSEPECFLATELQGEIVGFVSWALNREKRVGEICNNAVAPEYQNRGIGTIQYERALDYFREQGMEVAVVTTGLDESHAPARRAYEKAGFDRSVPSVRYYQSL